MTLSELGGLLTVRTSWTLRADFEADAIFLKGLKLVCDGDFVRVAQRVWTPEHTYYTPRVCVYAGDVEYLLDRLITIVEEGTYAHRLH